MCLWVINAMKKQLSRGKKASRDDRKANGPESGV